jgi:hypothetical protein
MLDYDGGDSIYLLDVGNTAHFHMVQEPKRRIKINHRRNLKSITQATVRKSLFHSCSDFI